MELLICIIYIVPNGTLFVNQLYEVKEMTKEILREDVKKAIREERAILVEALPELYYEEGHLPGAIQINYDEIDSKALSSLPDKDALIITYCASDTCPNSGLAAENLLAVGYTNVRKYVGGKKNWTEAGEKLELSQ